MSRGMSRSHPFTLDVIRNRSGVEGLKKAFHEFAGADRQNAAGMLNTERTEFPTLFALHPEIHKFEMYPHLNDRNRTALDISGEILNGTIRQTYRSRATDHGALRWMLDTGTPWDGMSDPFDEVMDKTTLMLTRVCKDKACQRQVAELFFSRNRKGGFTHDLVWAFFETSSPADLFLIADRLLSRNEKDAAMARDLLNFIPCIRLDRSPQAQHQCAVNWLRRNLRLLRYTGESYQQRSSPVRYELVNAAGTTAGGRE